MSLPVKNNRTPLFILRSIVVLAITVALFQLPFWAPLDNQYNDHWRRQIAENSLADPRLLVIEINNQSLNELESQYGRWPWPRTVYGFLVEGLIDAQSQAIVFDILFSERDKIQSDSDQHFAESVNNRKNIFYAATFLKEESPASGISFANLPKNFFMEAPDKPAIIPTGNFVLPWILDVDDWNIGLINYLADSDGVARRYPVVTDKAGWKMHSLPSRVVEYIEGYASAPRSDTSPQVASTAKRLPEVMNLKYKNLATSFSSISYSDAKYLLENQQQLELFKDKIVIIGATATGLHDLRSTPIDQLYPATYIIATAIDNLLNDDYLVIIERQYGLALLLTLLILLLIVMHVFDNYRTQVLLSTALVLFSAMGLFLLSFLLSKSGWLFPAASVLIILLISMIFAVFYRGFREYLQRRHALQTFSRFMDPEVVRQLISDEDWQNKLAHKSCDVSVLFSDIRGFTSLSEKRTAEQIMQILNDYFDLQVEAIFINKGTLDKFIGDAIMAFWGAPLEDERHAMHAVDTALSMVENLMKFRESLPQELKEFDVGIGIHSGPAVVGMLGSAKRFDYTAIGDTVNLASRIEGVTKGLARVLVSQQTRELCGNYFKFEYKGEFEVKGRKEKVKLYEPGRLS